MFMADEVIGKISNLQTRTVKKRVLCTATDETANKMTMSDVRRVSPKLWKEERWQ